MDILGDYRGYIARADELLFEYGIDVEELTQCDTLCYECDTDHRYDEVKNALARTATLLSERETNGRLVSILEMSPPLDAEGWRVPYIELLQPKPTRENIDGIDCVFFVTERSVREFRHQHTDVTFETKGLANKLHPYIELKGDGVAIKFHDRHFGSVVDLEHYLGQD